ncbi:MAG: undecaprenyl-diphosphate phosphatase [Simkania sp.]|nr:undecaprenyl-diphosphate phosphatase [Simkania sp.]
MTFLQALLLGVIQGITEFLPVSSSTHLTLAKTLMGLPPGEALILFDLLCHFGTLTITLYVFWQDIVSLFTFRKDKLWQIALAMLPLVPAYFLLRPLRQSIHGFGALGITLAMTSFLLFLGERFRIKQIASITKSRRARDAICIGALQAASLIPGISRSASTISCARCLGWNTSEAVRFSFLLAIPTIFGGNCLETLHLLKTSSLAHHLPISPICCLIGFGASAVGAFVVIKPAIRFLEKGRLGPVAWYCLVLGCSLIIFSLWT